MTRKQAAKAKELFLDIFRVTGNVSQAAKAAGIHRSSVYEWQESDEKFSAAYNVAAIESNEALEAEAHRRGVIGVKQPVYQGGQMVGYIKKYSDHVAAQTASRSDARQVRRSAEPEDRRERRHGGGVRERLASATDNRGRERKWLSQGEESLQWRTALCSFHSGVAYP